MINFKPVTDELEQRIINHDLINIAVGKRKSVPHEWFFIKYLYEYEIFKDREIARAFVVFVLQFYPNYKWQYFNQNDYLATAIFETTFYDLQFRKIYEFNSKEKDMLAESMIFGDIVTDFLIRYCNYSLVKCSGENIIITAQDDCYKRFENLLSNGYSLQRRAKVGYIKMPDINDILYPGIKGFFYKLPVLPTRKTWYSIDEIIEIKEGKYAKVMH